MVFNYREMTEIKFWRKLTGAGSFAPVAATIIAIAATAMLGGAAVLSFGAAMAGAFLPHAAMLILARRCPPESAFALWAGKFLATILLLLGGAWMLHSAGALSAAFFVGGATAGLAFNIAQLARKTETA